VPIYLLKLQLSRGDRIVQFSLY